MVITPGPGVISHPHSGVIGGDLEGLVAPKLRGSLITPGVSEIVKWG